MFLKKVQAIHKDDSNKFSKKIEHLTKDEQQKELEKFIDDEDLSDLDVSELLYDLTKEHINLKKPAKTNKAKSNKRNLPTPETLAKKFSKELRDSHTKDQMASIIERNRNEKDPQVCHSHDFCDANMVMDSAFRSLYDGDYDICNDDEILNLWNKAWELAKKNEFYG